MTAGASEEERNGCCVLKVLSYNVHGLKRKVSDFPCLQFLNEFDYIFLNFYD